MRNEYNLEECPFCHGLHIEESQVQDRNGLIQFSCKCQTCKARGPYSTGKDTAKVLWNRRDGWD